MKILLIGGGTGGSTATVLAVAQAIHNFDKTIEFYLIGNRKSLDIKFLQTLRFPVTYLVIPAGKWRRYFSLKNFSDVFKTFFGFLTALWLIKKMKPSAIFGAGSFVQVPVVWAGYFLNIPAVVHQQDLEVTLATRLTANLAKVITVSFLATTKDLPQNLGFMAKLPKNKIMHTGNPVRREILKGSKKAARKLFGLNSQFPTILVMGGGSGSEKINRILIEALPELGKYVQIIHLIGAGHPKKINYTHPHYHPYLFLQGDINHAYAIADLVVARGGMATITELAALGKQSILIPMPNSPQFANVELLARLQCAVGIAEELFNSALLVDFVRKILWTKDIQETMKTNLKELFPRNADQSIAKIILNLCAQKSE